MIPACHVWMGVRASFSAQAATSSNEMRWGQMMAMTGKKADSERETT
jgi:hypothetical protein